LASAYTCPLSLISHHGSSEKEPQRGQDRARGERDSPLIIGRERGEEKRGERDFFYRRDLLSCYFNNPAWF
jgi:hypothetical protein